MEHTRKTLNPSHPLDRITVSAPICSFPGSRVLSCCRYSLSAPCLAFTRSSKPYLPGEGYLHVPGDRDITVEVHVEINAPVGPQDTLCLLNELSAAWFTAGWDGERTGIASSRAGKRSAPTSSRFLLLIRCMGSGSLWASHQSAHLCRSPFTGAGTYRGSLLGGVLYRTGSS